MNTEYSKCLQNNEDFFFPNKEKAKSNWRETYFKEIHVICKIQQSHSIVVAFKTKLIIPRGPAIADTKRTNGYQTAHAKKIICEAPYRRSHKNCIVPFKEVLEKCLGKLLICLKMKGGKIKALCGWRTDCKIFIIVQVIHCKLPRFNSTLSSVGTTVLHV